MLLGFLLVFSLLTRTCSYRIVCYYTNWAQYRPGIWKFLPENINSSLCTHIIFAFAAPMGLGIEAVEGNDVPRKTDIGMYKRVLKLRKENANLKVLLAIAGYHRDMYPYIPIVSTPTALATFVQNVLTFLRRYDFDGLDVNWIYPGTRVRPVIRKEKFVSLMEELHTIFETDGAMRGQPRLLLSAGLPSIKEIIDYGYDPVGILKYADFISIQTFDLHGGWETRVGFNAPLFPSPTDVSYAAYLNVDWVAKYYASLGVPKEKVNIGISLYARSFTLSKPSEHHVGARAYKPGKKGNVTGQEGFMAYYEVCAMIKAGANVVDDKYQRNRYLHLHNQWVGYDDIQSVHDKSCYVKLNEFGGVMVRSFDLDDFANGECGEGKYPLLSTINAVMTDTSKSMCKNYKPNLQAQSLATIIHHPGITVLTLGYCCVCFVSSFYFY